MVSHKLALSQHRAASPVDEGGVSLRLPLAVQMAASSSGDMASKWSQDEKDKVKADIQDLEEQLKGAIDEHYASRGKEGDGAYEDLFCEKAEKEGEFDEAKWTEAFVAALKRRLSWVPIPPIKKFEGLSKDAVLDLEIRKILEERKQEIQKEGAEMSKEKKQEGLDLLQKKYEDLEKWGETNPGLPGSEDGAERTGKGKMPDDEFYQKSLTGLSVEGANEDLSKKGGAYSEEDKKELERLKKEELERLKKEAGFEEKPFMA